MKSEVDRKKRLENDDEDSKLFRESEKRNEKTREESENESQVVNIYFIGKRESCFCHFLNT